VTDALNVFIGEFGAPSVVFAIGPAIMMKAVAAATKPFAIRTIVSLNTIMVDGTGMCGGCRVSIGGESKFVCVDGPEFDGHLVDFDLMMQRQRSYLEQEQMARQHLRAVRECRIGVGGGHEA
jgi:ferredoxin--NADP+ reductase